MKIIMFFVFSFIFLNNINAQVGIGTNSPNSSAALDISDSTRGLLIPRMTMAKRQAIPNPAKGLLVYQTDNTRGLWSYSGSAWSNLPSAVLSADTGFMYQVKSTRGELVAVYTNSNAYAFSNVYFPGATWYPIALTGTPLGAIADDYSVMIYTTTTAFAFTTPLWSSQPITGTPVGISAAVRMIVLSTSTNLYGYTFDDPAGYGWYNEPISGMPLGALASTGSLGAGYINSIIVYTSSFAYALRRIDGITPQWYSQALSGTALGGSATGNAMVVYTSTNAYGFIPGTATWYPTLLSGTAAGVSP